MVYLQAIALFPVLVRTLMPFMGFGCRHRVSKMLRASSYQLYCSQNTGYSIPKGILVRV